MTNYLRPIFQDLLTIQEQMNSLFGDISLVRTFTLPGSLQQDKAKATLKHGLLKVVLPKVEVASQ